MTRDDVTREQAEVLKRNLRPMLAYLGRLKSRMTRRRFQPSDPLVVAVCRAEDAMHALTVHVHYLTCEHGVGRLPQPHNQTENDVNQRRGD
jgi:hypothetical protein